MRTRKAPISFLSAVEVQSIRLWPRIWPWKWGIRFPNRALARLTGMGLLRPIWVEFQPGLWMKLDIREVIQETLLEEGVWERETTRYITTILKPGNVFLDIGANAGYFSLLAGRCVGPAGRVLAVEPNPAMAEQVRLNAARTGLKNVEVAEVACSGCSETRKLFLGIPYFTGQTSLSEQNVKWKDCIDVPCVQADQLCSTYGLSRIDLIKIDVEGAEQEVLRGMDVILREIRPHIVMELLEDKLRSFSTTVDSVKEYLKGFEYTVRPIGEHSNYLCVPSEHLHS
jgi:FkbM family methyltransferase